VFFAQIEENRVKTPHFRAAWMPLLPSFNEVLPKAKLLRLKIDMEVDF
jgi:hypothetical protein